MLSNLVNSCVLRPTQSPTLSGMGNEYWHTGLVLRPGGAVDVCMVYSRSYYLLAQVVDAVQLAHIK